MSQMLKEYMERYDGDKYVFKLTYMGRTPRILIILKLLEKSTIKDSNCWLTASGESLYCCTNAEIIDIIDVFDIDRKIDNIIMHETLESKYGIYHDKAGTNVHIGYIIQDALLVAKTPNTFIETLSID